MNSKSHLIKYLKQLSCETTHILDDMWTDERNTRLVKIPIFKNGQLVGFNEHAVVNYAKINLNVRFNKNVSKLLSFKVTTNVLKQILKNMQLDNKIGENIDIVNMAKEEISNFITQYTYERYDNYAGSFLRSVKKFQAHITTELSSSTYITPLYNLNGNFSEIILSKKTRIRPVTNLEYLRMVNTQKSIDEIDDYQKRLRFVIEYHAGKVEKPLDKAKNEYAFVTNMVRLTFKGAPEFGQIYLLNSRQLNVLDVSHADVYESTPRQTGFTTLTGKDARILVAKYSDTASKIAKGKKTRFLANSIGRFGMASRHRNCSNKIVDYVIALESLLIESPGESTLKLAHRVAALCGNNDNDRLYVWEFMKAAYRYRSGVVHESTERSCIINSKVITIDEVSERLAKITASAILRTVKILDMYDSKDKIVQRLDRSIYDKSLMTNLRKHWNS